VVRYADDFIVVAPSKKMLLVLMPAIEEFLLERGLKVLKRKSSIFNIWESEVRFLGFSFRKRAFNYRTRSEVAWEKRNTKSLARIEIIPKRENKSYLI